MLSRSDVIGKIADLYRAEHEVPYLTFMHIFADLVTDRRDAVPREPSDELKESFRAVCMCVGAGVFDAEGRGEARVRQFNEKILPLWKAKLPPEEFARYEALIKAPQLRRLKALEAQDMSDQAATERSRRLLAKLGLAGGRREPEPEKDAAARGASAGADSDAFDDVEQLCGAIRSGALPVEFKPRGEAGEFARYRIEGQVATVKLAQAEGKQYVVLSADVGREGVPDAVERLDLFAAEAGYARMADFAYMRKDGQFIYTVGVGPHVTNIACATEQESRSSADVLLRLGRLHRDMGELIERMRS